MSPDAKLPGVASPVAPTPSQPRELHHQRSTNLRLPAGLASILAGYDARLDAVSDRLDRLEAAATVEPPVIPNVCPVACSPSSCACKTLLVNEYHKHVKYVDGIEVVT